MTHKELIDYYDKLDDNIKNIINDTMFATMNMCSELLNEPIIFNSEEDFSNFRETTLLHLANNEFYDYDTKKWINIDPIIPNSKKYKLN